MINRTYPKDKYLVKFGLEGKAKQFLDPRMTCQSEPKETGFSRLFEDERGNICVSTVCVRVSEVVDVPYEGSSYVRFESKCFGPEDFKNVIKLEAKIVDKADGIDHHQYIPSYEYDMSNKYDEAKVCTRL
ncbi:hypothetical protein TKK_0006640 [Trichogramma kaykai]|uniref:Uncharacterized protein n=1 Tax=Trichogramma kaykai TaxID=54128 RepID=A0ABD2XC47_9HYME